MAFFIMAATTVSEGQAPKKSAPPPNRGALAPNVSSEFVAAQKLFDEGKFPAALTAFTKIMRKYPGYTPALIFYAKTLYRLERIPESYQYFSKIDVNALDIVTSYEYALSFFWMRQYNGAFVGFTRVPPAHALSDLANYYGGIAAMKIHRYADAEAMMEKAVVLPTKLARSRRLYLKHIRELKLLQEKNALARERDVEKQRLESKGKTKLTTKTAPVAEAKAATADKTAAAAVLPAAPVPFKHQGFKAADIKKEANLGISYKEQTQDFHGYASEKSTVQTNYFAFNAGLALPLPHKVDDRDTAAGFQVLLRAEELLTKGEGERRNVQTDGEEDIQRIISKDPTRALTRAGIMQVDPWIEFAMPHQFWTVVGGRYFLRYPDFTSKDRSGSRSGFLQTGQKTSAYEIYGRYKYLEVIDAFNNPAVRENTVTLRGDIPFMQEIYWLTLIALHSVFSYPDEARDGATSASSLSGDFSRALPLGFYLGIYGAAQYQSQNVIHGLPTYGTVNADGQVYTGRLYLLIEPITWFKGEIAWETQHSDWQVTPEAAQQVYEQNQINNLETFEAKASINLLF